MTSRLVYFQAEASDTETAGKVQRVADRLHMNVERIDSEDTSWGRVVRPAVALSVRPRNAPLSTAIPEGDLVRKLRQQVGGL